MKRGKRRHVETSKMKEYKAIHENNEVKKRRCTFPGCKKTFLSLPGLRYHVNTHSPVKSSFTCPQCHRSFISNNGLKYHRSKLPHCTPSSKITTHSNQQTSSFTDSGMPKPSSLTIDVNNDIQGNVNKYHPDYDDDNKLRDLAIIATGPQSPLLQSISFTESLESRCQDVKRALDLSCNKPKTVAELSLSLSQLDSSAVIALSSMAQKKRERERILSPPCFPTLPDSPPCQVKRPMNGFMLFAKRKRLEYKEKHPDRDNRAISKLLGEKWNKLDLKNKQRFKEEAKKLSLDLQKIHPQCWKQKR